MKNKHLIILLVFFVNNSAVFAQNATIAHPHDRIAEIAPLSAQERQKAINPPDDGKSLPIPELKDGVAIVAGQLTGYSLQLPPKIEIHTNNPLTSEREIVKAEIDANGVFVCQIPLVSTTSVLLQINSPEIRLEHYIVISPDKTTNIYIERKLNTTAQYIYFTEQNAEINNQLTSPLYNEFQIRYSTNTSKMLDDIVGMSAEEYKNYHLDRLQNTLAKLNVSSFTKKAKEYIKLNEQYKTFEYLSDGKHHLRSAHSKADNGNSTGFKEPYFPDDYYCPILQNMPINDPISLYVHRYSKYLSASIRSINTKFSLSMLRISPELIATLESQKNITRDDREIIAYTKTQLLENLNRDSVKQIQKTNLTIIQDAVKSDLLNPALREAFEKMIKNTHTNNVKELHEYNELVYLVSFLQEQNNFLTKSLRTVFPIAIDTILQNKSNELIYKKYSTITDSIHKRQQIEKLPRRLTNIIGVDEGIAFDLIRCEKITNKFETLTSLDTSDFEILKEMNNPFYYHYLTRQNEAIIVKIKDDKKKPYTVHTITEIEPAKVLDEIIKTFEGKVIFIDFWATWCGPCRSDIKAFADTKKTFATKDIAFVYITDQSSPPKVWESMIPGIGGEHYRLENKQYEFLKNKYEIESIPVYLILNKKGEQVYFKRGFEGSERMKKRLNEELEK